MDDQTISGDESDSVVGDEVALGRVFVMHRSIQIFELVSPTGRSRSLTGVPHRFGKFSRELLFSFGP